VTASFSGSFDTPRLRCLPEFAIFGRRQPVSLKTTIEMNALGFGSPHCGHIPV
jgi:hypothetical protein